MILACTSVSSHTRAVLILDDFVKDLFRGALRYVNFQVEFSPPWFLNVSEFRIFGVCGIQCWPVLRITDQYSIRCPHQALFECLGYPIMLRACSSRCSSPLRSLCTARSPIPSLQLQTDQPLFQVLLPCPLDRSHLKGFLPVLSWQYSISGVTLHSLLSPSLSHSVSLLFLLTWRLQ